MTEPDAPTPAFPAPRQRWASAIGDDPAAISSLSTPVLRKDAPIAVIGGALTAALIAPLAAAGFQPIAAERRHPILAEIAGEDPEYEAFGNGHGEIHSARAFRQLIERAARTFAPAEDRWHEDGRVVDAFRPNLRYAAASDVEFDVLQARHLNTVRAALRRAGTVLVALSASEIWEARADGAAFPHWGDGGERRFDAERHRVRVVTVEESVADLTAAAAALRGLNPTARIVMMISPEPQPATALPHHVVAAAVLGKAVLRIAIETVAQAGDLWYFPALEIAGVGAPMAAYPGGGAIPDVVVRTVADALLAVSEGGSVAFTQPPAAVPVLGPAAAEVVGTTATPATEPAEPEPVEAAPAKRAAARKKPVTVTVVDPYTLAKAAEEKERAAKLAAKRAAKAAAESLRDETLEAKRAANMEAPETRAAALQARKDLRPEKRAQMLATRQAKVAAREARQAGRGASAEPKATPADAAPAKRERGDRAPRAAAQAGSTVVATPTDASMAERKARKAARRHLAKAAAPASIDDPANPPQARRGPNAKRRSPPGRVPPTPS